MKTEEKSFKGFVVVFQQRQESWIKNQLKALQTQENDTNNNKLTEDIQRRIRKSVIEHETITFVSKLLVINFSFIVSQILRTWTHL